MGAKWSAGDLSADVVSVSRAELESGGEPILAGAAAESRRGAYFRAVRFSRTRSGCGMPEARHSVRSRADRYVLANCEERVAKADVSWPLGPQDASWRALTDCDFGSGSGRAGFSRPAARPNRIAAERGGSSPSSGPTRHVSLTTWNSAECEPGSFSR